mgnify:FL=1
MTQQQRQMILAGFLQAANCSNYTGSWRHPESDLRFLTPEFYQDIAKTLEKGKFHLAFVDDRLAMPSRYGGSFSDPVKLGIRVVKLDLVPILTAMGLSTTHLGLGATYSTSYYSPYHIARLFSTLDHMTNGRIAWNIVTSLNDSEAQNFGIEEVLDHDLRYDKADELVRLVSRLWDSWDDNALIMDRENGLFADPDRVHSTNYQGNWFKSQGPLTVPRSPQGQPVLIQAGQSDRGREFASQWGELIFTIYPDAARCKDFYNDVKMRAEQKGREPENIIIAPAIYVVAGETTSIATEKYDEIKSLAHTSDSLTLLSEVFNYDFSQHGLDEQIGDDIIESLSGLRGFIDRIVDLSGNPNPSVRDFLEHSGRGTLSELPCFVGTPKDIADEMEEWFLSESCDGFVLSATHIPGAYNDFVKLIVPELQKRGLFRNDYSGTTLRQNLGLPNPETTR